MHYKNIYYQHFKHKYNSLYMQIKKPQPLSGMEYTHTYTLCTSSLSYSALEQLQCYKTVTYFHLSETPPRRFAWSLSVRDFLLIQVQQKWLIQNLSSSTGRAFPPSPQTKQPSTPAHLHQALPGSTDYSLALYYKSFNRLMHVCHLLWWGTGPGNTGKTQAGKTITFYAPVTAN